MAFEHQRDNSGAIFVNDRKEKDTHPDSQGSALIDGVEHWVSGWRRVAKSGKPYLSLAFKRKDADAAVDKSQPIGESLNDSIGF